MALTLNYTIYAFGQDIICQDAYIKINRLFGDKEEITFELVIKTDTKLDSICNKIYSYTPNLEGANFIAQGYDYLKTLPEFADAFNC
jgi:hypothetical protein